MLTTATNLVQETVGRLLSNAVRLAAGMPPPYAFYISDLPLTCITEPGGKTRRRLPGVPYLMGSMTMEVHEATSGTLRAVYAGIVREAEGVCDEAESMPYGFHRRAFNITKRPIPGVSANPGTC